ncbi:hypothetical protein PENTCL1PPCAC_28583, partial [Pristionchus entomophagus]
LVQGRTFIMTDISKQTFNQVGFGCDTLLSLTESHLHSTVEHYRQCVYLHDHRHLLCPFDVAFIEEEVDNANRLRRRLTFICENIAETIGHPGLSTLTRAARLLHFRELVADLQDHHTLLRASMVFEVRRRFERTLRLLRMF